MSSRILFFGNERIATGVNTEVPTLQALIQAGYEVAAVVVAQNDPGKSRKARQLEIAAIAESHNIPVISPSKLSESVSDLASFKAEAAVLVAFGKIVPQTVIDIFPRGIINIHPSLLPKHRGPTPIESVILNGEGETGVSLMQLSAEMDAGPVFAQETILLNGRETKQQLADQLLGIGKDMLMNYLPQIIDGSLPPITQKESNATYDNRIGKVDGVLDFVGKNAEQLEREVRAFAGWPRSRAKIGTTEVVITQAHAADTNGTPGTPLLDGTTLGIYASQGALVIDSLIPSGKKEMPTQAFLAGYKP